jgi:hypothetical protein
VPVGFYCMLPINLWLPQSFLDRFGSALHQPRGNATEPPDSTC